MQDEAAPPGPEQDGQFPRWLFWLGIILLVLLLVVLAVWTQRTPIADNLISRELVKRNISARYDIAEIGLRTQRLENLTLGNPEQPDLSADWRSEEHTSEIQSLMRISYAGFCLKKKKYHIT